MGRMEWRTGRACLAVVALLGAVSWGDVACGQATSGAPYGVVVSPVSQPQAQSQPQRDPLIQQLDTAIEATKNRYLTAQVHTPWQIFHGILAVRQEFQLKLGGEKVNAVEWISTANPTYEGQPLIQKTLHGAKFHAFTRPYVFEGHPAQFLALLGQCNLPLDHKFATTEGVVTLEDMLQNTMMEVNSKEEITWVLWALNHYLKPEAAWHNQANEAWSIERLVDIQVKGAVVGTACGGNHGLFALCRSRDKLLATGQPLRGAWLEADRKIKQYVEIARSLQNTDGSMSANFYRGAKFSGDMNTRLNHSGHTLEFLSIGLPNERLNEPWVRRGYAMLAHDVHQSRTQSAEPGPLYHSLNALILYRERLGKLLTPAAAPQLAKRPEPTPAAAPQVAANPPAVSGTRPVVTPQQTAKPVIPVGPAPSSKPGETARVPQLLVMPQNAIPAAPNGEALPKPPERAPQTATAPTLAKPISMSETVIRARRSAKLPTAIDELPLDQESVSALAPANTK